MKLNIKAKNFTLTDDIVRESEKKFDRLDKYFHDEENKPAYKAGYKTIDEIGRARIEKAAQKIKKETGADIDYGYKLYYLENPSEKTLMDLENFVPENKLMIDDMVSVFDNKHSKGKESILATWINEDGYGLSKSSKPYRLENYQADLIEKTLYIIDEGLKQEDSMERNFLNP